jgi:excisionase family DNA binding protein
VPRFVAQTPGVPRTDPPSRTDSGAATLLTPEQVAQLAQVAVRTVYGWIASGELKATKLGRRYRITEAAWAEFVANHTPALSLPAPTEEAS